MLAYELIDVNHFVETLDFKARTVNIDPIFRNSRCEKSISYVSKYKDKEKFSSTRVETRKHKLIQPETTRWNTDYYMLDGLLEQQMPIYNALIDMGKLYAVNNLRDDQQTLASHVISLLKPFEEVTKN
uniref:Uncharacterized protein n=1 Tax=Romanomermis culicivorax TaxID=13658 RepID=A0A915IAQ0_ROMCU